MSWTQGIKKFDSLQMGPWTRRIMLSSALVVGFLGFSTRKATGPDAPTQPADGPGGANYTHAQVIMQDSAQKTDGYWLFEPAAPRPDSAHVVVFLHGYASINPMAYGGWIRHLVRKGNIVIFPRFQRDMFVTPTEHFPINAAKGIKDAIHALKTGDHVRPIVEPLVLIGHSYGGVTAAYLGVKFKKFGLPQPKGLLLCAPGTGPLNGAKLDDYGKMPADTKLLIINSNDDQVVGEPFQRKIFNTAIHTRTRNFLKLLADDYGSPALKAHHNACYSLDEAFDCGMRNPTIYRSYLVGQTDAIDYYGFWKWGDALIDCVRSGENCTFAFGGTEEQKSLGVWADGKKVKELEVWTQ
jgi:pimeloyl-ACP methyl ester carboxylesterase